MNDYSTTYTDQMGQTIHAPKPPRRIISLVPSLTELLFDLGLADRIVGRTKFCIHPAASVKQVQSIGGTKQFRFDKIAELAPDLIIGNKEENYVDGITQLAESYPVWMSDIYTLNDALWMIRELGQVVDRKIGSESLADQIEASFTSLQPLADPLRAGYLIWHKPYMAVGRNTFIHDMLFRCGFVNAFADQGDGRYPEVTAEEISAANLDVLLLSSEPFPFAEKHRAEIAEMFPNVAVHLVDGEMFSWYGSRLLRSVDYFRGLVDMV